MKKIFAVSLIIFCLSVLSVFAQTSTVTRFDLSQPEIDRIIKKFTENEAHFRGALTNYVFNRSVTLQTLGMGGQITGLLRRDSFMSLTQSGERLEKVTFNPVSTLPLGFVTAEDLEDLGGVTPFALEPSVVNLYNFVYLGKEKIDDLDLYVFEVSPKVIPDPKKSKQRLFTGRIWVDDKDLMIAKSKGKGVPETKTNKFPVVETWRENIDGKYWFPSYASSDDELLFENGTSVKLKLRVKYTNYRLGHTEVIIGDDAEEVKDDAKPTPTPTPAPTNTPPKKP
ncbi:MAG TPA: hypothetical protein VGC76_08155 [Pyrinomonadaceae bacterium]